MYIILTYITGIKSLSIFIYFRIRMEKTTRGQGGEKDPENKKATKTE